MIGFVLLTVAVAVVAIAVHEGGHAAAAQALRLPWKLYVNRRGIGIGYPFVLSRSQTAITSAAGLFASLALTFALWHVSRFGAVVSLDIVGWNLFLPHSDGALILRALRGKAIA